MEFENVLCTEKFALSTGIALHSGEISDETILVNSTIHLGTTRLVCILAW